jgi:hypothetical protein
MFSCHWIGPSCPFFAETLLRPQNFNMWKSNVIVYYALKFILTRALTYYCHHVILLPCCNFEKHWLFREAEKEMKVVWPRDGWSSFGIVFSTFMCHLLCWTVGLCYEGFQSVLLCKVFHECWQSRSWLRKWVCLGTWNSITLPTKVCTIKSIPINTCIYHFVSLLAYWPKFCKRFSFLPSMTHF